MRAEGGQAGSRAAGQWFREAVTALRRICGMPDYRAYVEHLRDHHPECAIPTEREFFAQYTEARYGNGASRCC